MADEHDREGEFTYSYDYSADGEPAGPAGGSVDCPACRGTGREMLLFIAKPCQACGGTGKMAFAAPLADSTDSTDSTSSPQASSPQACSPREGTGDHATAREKRVEGHWVTTCTFDQLYRVVSVVDQFVPDPPQAGKRPSD